jgi:uncharacterized protein (TIGR02588 family)
VNATDPLKHRERPRKNVLEWLVFAASLLVIGTVVGFLAYEGLTMGREPARLQVLLGEPRQEETLFVVPVVVENKGGKAAAGVRVEVLLEAPGGTERVTFDLPHAPAGSMRRGQAAFRSDPREGRMSGRAVGFELP